MTKKRFKHYRNNDGTSMIYDKEQQKYYFYVDFDNICDILNNFHEDNNALIKIIENQSYIIQQLHTKLIEYELKEPIKLTVEDIELMGKAISYYTHGRYAE